MYGLDLSNIKVGDTVYIVDEDKRNFNRFKEAKVVKIGREYITVDFGYCQGKFSKYNGHTHSYGDEYLYPSKEEYDKHHEYQEKAQFINRNLDWVLRHEMNREEIDTVYGLIKKYKK